MLAKVDSASGNQENIFSYLEEYRSVAEAVDRRKTDFRTRELLIEYQVEEKERQYLALRQEAALAKEKNLLTTAGSIVFLLVAIAFFFAVSTEEKNQ